MVEGWLVRCVLCSAASAVGGVGLLVGAGSAWVVWCAVVREHSGSVALVLLSGACVRPSLCQAKPLSSVHKCLCQAKIHVCQANIRLCQASIFLCYIQCGTQACAAATSGLRRGDIIQSTDEQGREWYDFATRESGRKEEKSRLHEEVSGSPRKPMEDDLEQGWLNAWSGSSSSAGSSQLKEDPKQVEKLLSDAQKAFDASSRLALDAAQVGQKLAAVSRTAQTVTVSTVAQSMLGIGLTMVKALQSCTDELSGALVTAATTAGDVPKLKELSV